MRVATYKVPGGKFVRARLELDAAAEKIVAAQLSGDFFVTPPEKLAAIEAFLRGWQVAMPDGESQLGRRIEKRLAHERVTLTGLDGAAFAHVVYLALAADETPERVV